jgi:hypothetical protein
MKQDCSNSTLHNARQASGLSPWRCLCVVRTRAMGRRRRPSRLRTLVPAVALGGVLGLLGLLPGTAAAADRTVGFDDLAANTVLSTQYSSFGVAFGMPYRGTSGNQITVAASGFAHSAPNVAVVSCTVEVCAPIAAFVDFVPAVNHVSVSVGSLGSGDDPAMLVAFDSNGNKIASDSRTAINDSFATQLSVAAPAGAATIAHVEIDFAGKGSYGFDDLSFGPIASTPTPDFSMTLVSNSDGVGLAAGGPAAQATIAVHRFGGSAGAITFSHGALPAGVSLSVAPSPDSGGDGSTVSATFTAAFFAPAVSQFPVTITGTPAPSAGASAHSVTVPVTVQGVYGLRVQGIEVTQGIQTFTLPQRLPLDQTAVPYSGVKLIANMPTVVRVYADAPDAPPSGVQGASVELSGTDRAGRALVGGPLAPVSDPSEAGKADTLVDSGSATVPLSERDSASGSYDFALPRGWIGSAASLTATLVPPPLSLNNSSSAVPCSDPSCVALRTFTLDGLSTIDPGTTEIDAVQLAVNGSTPQDPGFAWAERLMPANVFFGGDVGTIDITWVSKGCPLQGFGDTCAGRSAQNAVALSAVEDFASNYADGQGPAMAGVTSQNLGVEDGNTFTSGSEPVAVVDATRPVTDVMHEIGHMFGLPHASAECGGGQDNDGDDTGQTGEPWPPDQQGYIDGIGLDIAAGPPYPVVAGPGGSERSIGTGPGQCAPNQNPPECGLPKPQQFFDFMSYCTASDPNSDGTLGSTNAWISVRNWDYIATYSACVLAGGGSGCEGVANSVKAADAAAAGSQQATAASVRRAGTPLATETSGVGMVRVYGFSAGKQTAITLIDPTPSRRPLTGTRSPLTLVLQGPNGRVLSSAPILENAIHVDGVAPIQFLQAAVPDRPGATGLAILGHGKVIAERRRPPHLPHLTLIAPRGAKRLTGAAPVIVRWRATDPDRVHLIVSIDFSADDGRIWRTVYSGPNNGDAAIPPRYLTGSTHERVRLRVNDMFDQVTVTSRPFALTRATRDA